MLSSFLPDPSRMTPRACRVVVAMSGGVDSSVAAALLVRQGCSVSGVMMRMWSEETTAEDSAREAADRIGIPFRVLDVREAFHTEVVRYLIENYQAGRTPNPCMQCNRRIKWEYLLREAQSACADYVATGHYARILQGPSGAQLWKGCDPRKDQSYMLAGLDQEQLARTLLPLGEWRKDAVRAMAREFQLAAADRTESQDLCFADEGGYRRILERYAPGTSAPGPIEDAAGRVLGWHGGTSGYTIGQRKGIRISAPKPLYVTGIDAERRAVVVGPVEALCRTAFRAGPLRWIGDSPPLEFTATVMVRYRAQEVDARVIVEEGGGCRVQLLRSVRDLTPGQAAVFYAGDQCLGMATILESIA